VAVRTNIPMMADVEVVLLEILLILLAEEAKADLVALVMIVGMVQLVAVVAASQKMVSLEVMVAI